MSQQDLTASGSSPPGRPFVPVLLVLFVGSGCSALIYEIVWFQLLQLVIGSSAVSLGVLLGTFMGGMCLGSLALPRLVSPGRHPLRVYALLELGIGVLGIVALFVMPSLGHVYVATAGTGFPGFLLRGAVCAVCLLPPTVLMGATLPAIARWVETTPEGVSWLGLFYGGNIAGAVFGCLLAGFYLLRVHDMAIATYVAATLNGTVALLSLALATRTAYHPVATTDRSRKRPEPVRGPWLVYVTIALSGASALAAEVIWTRLLSLMLGATVYTFSIILAVFLVGLGLGSGIGSFLARTSPRPRILLGWCQLLLAGAIAWTAAMLANSLPYWPVAPELARSPWHVFQLDLVRCMWAIFPATCLWGASFPLALAAGVTRGQDPGRLVGGMYAANTVGAIVGAIGASLFLIRWVGTQDSQRLLIGLSTLAGLLMLAPAYWPLHVSPSSDRRPFSATIGITDAVLLAIALAGPGAFLAWSVPRVPWELVAYGRSLLNFDGQADQLYVGEGMNSSIAVTELPGGVRNFHVSGKVEASTEPQDMRLQRMLGHLPALFHPNPRSVLVVGFGAGVTAGSFLVHPSVERVVICEIEPLIPQAIGPHFRRENYNVIEDERVNIVHDDARHFVLTTPRKFDIITSDPIHPWVKGAAALYTREYFELCKRHLNPGGLITQWVPLYESNLEVVKSEIATFFEVFPNGTIWANEKNGQGYDVVLLARVGPGPLTINADELQQRLSQADHVAVRESLEDVAFHSVVGLLSTYGGQASDLGPWVEDAEINRDRTLRLQFLAGMALNTQTSHTIYTEILSYRRFPENLFTGSGFHSRSVRMAIEGTLSGRKKGAEE